MKEILALFIQCINGGLQWFAKVFIPLELFHILPRYDHKLKVILCGRPTQSNTQL